MLCPTDQTSLDDQRRGDLRFGYCRQCHGLWFARGMLEMSDHFHAPLPRETRRPKTQPPSEGIGPRRCSHCAVDLRGECIDGIAVDRCPACGGVWLEPGEFEPVRAWYLAQREAAGEFTRYSVADGVVAGFGHAADGVLLQALLSFMGHVAQTLLDG